MSNILVFPKRNETLVYLFNSQSKKCAYCNDEMTLELKRPKTATIDHIIPISEGGNSTLFNLVAACSDCNGKKSNKPLFRFLSILNNEKQLKRKEKKELRLSRNQKQLDLS